MMGDYMWAKMWSEGNQKRDEPFIPLSNTIASDCFSLLPQLPLLGLLLP